MDMHIWDFTNNTDQNTLKEQFLDHLRRQDIVPFFGSGFTRGCPASKGTVPSVDELKAELVDIVAGIENYSANDRAELERMKLSEVAEIFWPALEHNDTPQAYRDQFDAYVEDHFCRVHDLPVECHELIGCRWRYLYTLNYDDAIERIASELRVITPYSNQNQRWLAQKRRLYKIHGDSTKFLETGEKNIAF